MMLTTEQTVRAELLDCVQSNLAVLADRFHGPDSHLALGATLRFRPHPGAAGLPTVEPPLLDQVLEATRQLGLVRTTTWHGGTREPLRELSGRHGVLYVVADSFDMPWLPYSGRRHMDHSFLVEADGDRATVVDAYSNHTQWGKAEPGRWTTDWSTLPAASFVLLTAPAADVPMPLPHVGTMAATDYVDAYRRHPDRRTAFERLAVETWLLTRARKLHVAYRAHRGERVTDEVAAHLGHWDELAGRAFLAMRRTGSGRPAPEQLLTDVETALNADPEVFGGTREPVSPR
ncbi:MULTISPECIES: hypothetical protein [Amycolatopsis]|uniref:Butirosin biosynthesis protein H N-terminal domain-containing protein n=1 Tax=Amycolatopsis bullii TaxID=941987 RepID=A0ABQ3KD23_9PSEU|nr:hypothetical protein [Amycolatopsis bullii]GHG14363.1 hypothetical protein GCM10017567_35200 [Amycolatopsis bullii]